MTRRNEKQTRVLAIKERTRRVEQLLSKKWIKSHAEIPDDAIPVDPDKVNIGGSYFHPIYYKDVAFKCRDCGVEEVWSAEGQLWYYEETKALYLKMAVRCRSCRKKEQARKEHARIKAGHKTNFPNHTGSPNGLQP